MRKIVLLCALLVPFTTHLNAVEGIKVKPRIDFYWRANMLDAAKKFAAFIFSSKYVHGAAIGVGTALLVDIAIGATVEKRAGMNILLGRNEPKPPTSLVLLALVSAYGAYLSAHPPESVSDLAMQSAVTGAITGFGYLIWRLVQERTSKDVEVCTLSNNFKGCSKQAILNAIAILTSYIATQQLKNLGY